MNGIGSDLNGGEEGGGGGGRNGGSSSSLQDIVLTYKPLSINIFQLLNPFTTQVISNTKSLPNFRRIYNSLPYSYNFNVDFISSSIELMNGKERKQNEFNLQAALPSLSKYFCLLNNEHLNLESNNNFHSKSLAGLSQSWEGDFLGIVILCTKWKGCWKANVEFKSENKDILQSLRLTGENEIIKLLSRVLSKERKLQSINEGNFYKESIKFRIMNDEGGGVRGEMKGGGSNIVGNEFNILNSLGDVSEYIKNGKSLRERLR